MTNLSVPSVIFADASWYGSVRGGVTFGGGADTRFMDGGSRWGIKGSNELADGLSAIYQFEHKFSTEDAGMDGGGRLAHVGLSGGFGTLTLGQIWSASFNATGAITDNSLLWGDSATSYRVGNAVSYSNSVGNASLQIDAIMDSDRDTGDAVDQIEFGMSIGLGDIGKVAVGYVESKDTNIMTMVHKPAEEAEAAVMAVAEETEMFYVVDHDEDEDTASVEVEMADVIVWRNVEDTDNNGDSLDDDGALNGSANNAAFLNAIQISADGDYFYVDGTGTPRGQCMDDEETNAAECATITVFVQTTTATTISASANTMDATQNVMTDTTVSETYHLEADEMTRVTVEAVEGKDMKPYVPASTTKTADIKPGYKGAHIAAEFGIGGVTAWLGHSKTENNGDAIDMGTVAAPNTNKMTGGVVDATMMTKATDTKVTHAGVRGSVGDGGINYYVAYRSVDAAGAKSNPFLINLNQSLGDGATAFIEHANNDDGKSGKTWVGLKVDF